MQELKQDWSSLNAELACWSGAEAKVMMLSSSHRQLRISLWRFGGMNQLDVCCADPIFFSGPMRWKIGKVYVTAVCDDGTAYLQLRDDSIDLIAKCSYIFVELKPAMHWQQDS